MVLTRQVTRQETRQEEKPERAAHEQRTRYLISRLVSLGDSVGSNSVGSDSVGSHAEICREFDSAVEFAALDTVSIRQAIVDFVQERGNSVPEQLRKLALPEHSRAAAKLPVMPRAASRLLRTTDNGTSPAELESIAASDPVIAAHLLSAANSARFGSRFEISSLSQAVMRVGVPEARKILLAGCMAGLFASKQLKDLWEHSRTVAETAWTLAGECGLDAETAYVAGLLHDIGRLGFSTFPAAMQASEQDWLNAGFPRVYAETLVYGRDHAEYGAHLLRDWALPGGIVEAVECHHRPEFSESALSAVLGLAEYSAAQTAKGPEEDLWPGLRLQAALGRTELTRKQLEEALGKQPEAVRVCA